jgi:hypothetical protein
MYCTPSSITGHTTGRFVMCTINRNNIPRPSRVKIELELVVEQYLACCIAPSSMSSGYCDVLYPLGSTPMRHNLNPPCFSGMNDWFWAPYTTLSLWAPDASCDVGDMCLCSWTIFLWLLLWLLTGCLPWTGNWVTGSTLWPELVEVLTVGWKIQFRSPVAQVSGIFQVSPIFLAKLDH